MKTGGQRKDSKLQAGTPSVSTHYLLSKVLLQEPSLPAHLPRLQCQLPHGEELYPWSVALQQLETSANQFSKSQEKVMDLVTNRRTQMVSEHVAEQAVG